MGIWVPVYLSKLETAQGVLIIPLRSYTPLLLGRDLPQMPVWLPLCRSHALLDLMSSQRGFPSFS